MNQAEDLDTVELMNDAIGDGKLDVVREMIASGVDPECVSSDERTSLPLHNAVCYGYIDIAKLLIGVNGTDPDCRNLMKQTPLMVAAMSGELEIFKYLVDEVGVDLHAVDKDGLDSFHYATVENHPQVVEYIMTHKSLDVKARANSFTRALYEAAAAYESIDVLKFLLAHKSFPQDARPEHLKHMLFYAVGFGRRKTVKFLINEENVAPATMLKKGWTALHWATWNSDEDLVKFLIDQDKSVAVMTTTDGTNRTPLHMANHVECLMHLLNVPEVDRQARDEKGHAPLHHAAERGDIDVVDILLRVYDADTPTLDKDIRLALKISKDPGVRQLLIDRLDTLLIPLREQFENYLRQANHGDAAAAASTMIQQHFSWQRDRTLGSFIVPFETLSDMEPLGGGNFGEVFLARLGNAEKTKVVCKVSKAKDGAGRDEWQELRSLRHLPLHPSVVTMMGLCTDWDGDKVALLFEFHDGGDLKQATRKKGFAKDLARIGKIASSMTAAVHHLHEHHLLHRDIALRNFVLGGGEKSDSPVLIDFGLARQLDKNSAIEVIVSHEKETRRVTCNRNIDDVASEVYSSFFDLSSGGTPLTSASLRGNEKTLHVDITRKELTKEEVAAEEKEAPAQVYTKKGKTALPWRLIPLETFRDFTFSKHSDVYALGIAFWELFQVPRHKEDKMIPFAHTIWSMKQLKDVLENLATEAKDDGAQGTPPAAANDGEFDWSPPENHRCAPLDFGRVPQEFEGLIRRMCSVLQHQRPTALQVFERLKMIIKNVESEHKTLSMKEDVFVGNDDDGGDSDSASDEEVGEGGAGEYAEEGFCVSDDEHVAKESDGEGGAGEYAEDGFCVSSDDEQVVKENDDRAYSNADDIAAPSSD